MATVLLWLAIFRVFAIALPPCYPRGLCDEGYYDSTNGNSRYAQCGKDCVGGKYRTNGTCGCACKPLSQCQIPTKDPTLIPTQSPTSNRSTIIPSSSQTQTPTLYPSSDNSDSSQSSSEESSATIYFSGIPAAIICCLTLCCCTKYRKRGNCGCKKPWEIKNDLHLPPAYNGQNDTMQVQVTQKPQPPSVPIMDVSKEQIASIQAQQEGTFDKS